MEDFFFLLLTPLDHAVFPPDVHAARIDTYNAHPALCSPEIRVHLDKTLGTPPIYPWENTLDTAKGAAWAETLMRCVWMMPGFVAKSDDTEKTVKDMESMVRALLGAT